MRVVLAFVLSMTAASAVAQERSCISGRDVPPALSSETIRLGDRRTAFARFAREAVEEAANKELLAWLATRPAHRCRTPSPLWTQADRLTEVVRCLAPELPAEVKAKLVDYMLRRIENTPPRGPEPPV